MLLPRWSTWRGLPWLLLETHRVPPLLGARSAELRCDSKLYRSCAPTIVQVPENYVGCPKSVLHEGSARTGLGGSCLQWEHLSVAAAVTMPITGLLHGGKVRPSGAATAATRADARPSRADNRRVVPGRGRPFRAALTPRPWGRAG